MDRRSHLILLGVLPILFLTGAMGCSEKSTNTDTTPPAPPVQLASPPDDSWDETGTDAIPEEDLIQLVWRMGDEEDLAGYQVFRSSPPFEILSLLATKSVGGAEPDTIYQDRDVELGVRFAYAIKAFDRAANKSANSNEVDYMLIAKLGDEDLLSPRGETADRRPIFSWTSTGESIENYLRVYDVLEERTVWVSPGQDPFTSPHELIFNEDGTASDSLLIAGRQYWWRVDRSGSELRSGSESHWVSFEVR